MKIDECYLKSVGGWNSHYGDIIEIVVPTGQPNEYRAYRLNIDEVKDYIQSVDWEVREPSEKAKNNRYPYLYKIKK
jgi:hypothetical protein